MSQPIHTKSTMHMPTRFPSRNGSPYGAWLEYSLRLISSSARASSSAAPQNITAYVCSSRAFRVTRAENSTNVTPPVELSEGRSDESGIKSSDSTDDLSGNLSACRASLLVLSFDATNSLSRFFTACSKEKGG